MSIIIMGTDVGNTVDFSSICVIRRSDDSDIIVYSQTYDYRDNKEIERNRLFKEEVERVAKHFNIDPKNIL